MSAAIRALSDWVAGGSALAALVKVFGIVCAGILSLIYRRYLGILGADRRQPAERQAYDALREGLAKGNKAARIYAERLSQFLDWIDRFFGDAGMSDRTLFPHAFWLRTPAPLWTAPAFDRCLLLALTYPIATIVVICAISGHVGPAETALWLAPSMQGWRRWLLGVLFVSMTAAVLRSLRKPRGLPFVWFFALAFGYAGAGLTVVAAAGVVTGFAFAGTGVAAFVVAVAFPVAIVASGAVFPFAAGAASAFAGVISFASTTAITRGWQGPFLSLFVAITIATGLMAARLLSHLDSWAVAGPLLLFLGLLTLLNAPFDWVALGLTRALLRRGLELGGWWPYALALLDAGLAALIIAALALTMVVGVQAFDALAFHGGGTPVLPLDALFNGIGANPSAPEYWWLCALLLSTMIPSCKSATKWDPTRI